HTRFSRDWSSDVCSSDAGRLGLPDRQRRWPGPVEQLAWLLTARILLPCPTYSKSVRKELSVIRLCVIGCLSLTIVGSIGCGPKKPEMYKVTGTVKYADGTVPQGEVRIIRFEPESFASG